MLWADRDRTEGAHVIGKTLVGDRQTPHQLQHEGAAAERMRGKTDDRDQVAVAIDLDRLSCGGPTEDVP